MAGDALLSLSCSLSGHFGLDLIKDEDIETLRPQKLVWNSQADKKKGGRGGAENEKKSCLWRKL